MEKETIIENFKNRMQLIKARKEDYLDSVDHKVEKYQLYAIKLSPNEYFELIVNDSETIVDAYYWFVNESHRLTIEEVKTIQQAFWPIFAP